VRNPSSGLWSASLTSVGMSLRGARAAVTFLTRIPVGGFPYEQDEWRWAAVWFPVVGAAVGASAAIIWLLAQPLGLLTAAVASVGWTMALTGALHEDGLADTADALGGASNRSHLFEILKDSRIGTFGAASLIMSVLLRVTLLASLANLAPVALVTAHCLARTPPVLLLVTLDYVTPEPTAKGRSFSRLTRLQAILAATSAIAIAVGLIAATALPIRVVASGFGAVGLATVCCAAVFRRRAGGVTGDFLGAAEQVAECAVLFAAAMVDKSLPPGGADS
jgi:adenosylcobinamide-GDP ribazoletransferase